MEAIYFGTFAPLHQGHMSLVIYGKRKYDKLNIVCSGFSNDRGDIAGINLYERFRTIRQIFSQDELVAVHMLNEDVKQIPRYPEGWDFWLKYMKELVGELENKVFICAEQEYADELKKRGYHVDLQDRSILPVSGTQIRQNPYQNWDYVNKFFKKFFTKKVLIYGTASTGKTTLTIDLARYYNTSFSLEYAREYEERYNVLDDELDIRDLTNMGIGQYNQNKEHIYSPACNKIFFADTDVMTTMNYLQYYMHDDPQMGDVKNIFQGLIDKQNWDLILFLQPDTEYKDDGFRDMTHSSYEFREKFNQIFKQTLIDNNLDFHMLHGSFNDKFLNAKVLCDKLLKEDNNG